MQYFARFLMVAIACNALAACEGGKAPTPPTVTAQFHALLDSLDDAPPGTAVVRLEEFARLYPDYAIVDTAQAEIARFRTTTAGDFHAARELARQGQFDQAESILEDLARYLPETPDGELAKRHLKFDFYFAKAQWLMVRQRHEESAVVASQLLDSDLSVYQANQVEMLLDNAANVDAALIQIEHVNARNSCRDLSILLMQRYAEEGMLPGSLSLADIAALDPYNSASIMRGLSSIEDYEVSEYSFSFTGVSKKGHHRIRVEDGLMMD
ncbi:hypothetical protein DRQ53_03170 [bacterium]|nr:MAG: hypothetical protein DRQ53_03170 [bacterium]